ncbi:DUF2442 domain-containing protein [Paucibacter sp. XJ19-41]|uniref:DUF2442 domain-containing protein n=1 Tax=Paucibacter sp. XJ19-41 TaxID=2927824 RepID=UPI00234B3C83|nr:DUF2442 domain-containing protein [Paucibacter sp. XJ19-41]MDC6171261.1 DUF2442 domain-containing protein [Paucibacter sp. XJ19-41]
MTQKQFSLIKVLHAAPAKLVLHYADGEVLTVDLQPIIERHKSLAALKDPKVFAKAKIGDDGATVVWGNDDDLELAADNLRARAIEQAGGVSHEFIWNWMHRNKLTLDDAASALDVSRRMLAYYRSGEKSVPMTIGYACLGWEKARKANTSVFALAA